MALACRPNTTPLSCLGTTDTSNDLPKCAARGSQGIHFLVGTAAPLRDPAGLKHQGIAADACKFDSDGGARWSPQTNDCWGLPVRLQSGFAERAASRVWGRPAR